MEDVFFIQIITDIQIIVETSDNSKIMLVHVKGYSLNERPGIPMLKLRSSNDAILNNGLVEFDFMATPSTTLEKKERLEWEIKNVYNIDEFPKNLKAVKICAAYNADIAMLFREMKKTKLDINF